MHGAGEILAALRTDDGMKISIKPDADEDESETEDSTINDLSVTHLGSSQSKEHVSSRNDKAVG